VTIPARARLVLATEEGRPLEIARAERPDWSGEPARESGDALKAAGTVRSCMAIFVTGSTGYLGQYLAAGLLAPGTATR